MLIKIRYPNRHSHGHDLLCLNLMNYSRVWEKDINSELAGLVIEVFQVMCAAYPTGGGRASVVVFFEQNSSTRERLRSPQALYFCLSQAPLSCVLARSYPPVNILPVISTNSRQNRDRQNPYGMNSWHIRPNSRFSCPAARAKVKAREMRRRAKRIDDGPSLTNLSLTAWPNACAAVHNSMLAGFL